MTEVRYDYLLPIKNRAPLYLLLVISVLAVGWFAFVLFGESQGYGSDPERWALLPTGIWGLIALDIVVIFAVYGAALLVIRELPARAIPIESPEGLSPVFTPPPAPEEPVPETPPEPEPPAYEPEPVEMEPVPEEAPPEATPWQPEPEEPEAIVMEPLPDEPAPLVEVKPTGEPVIDIEGIGPVYTQRLAESGITTTDQLVAQDPHTLAERVGAPVATIQKWQTMSELMRLKGVGPQYAELMTAAGVVSIADLAGRNPEQLHAAIDETQKGRETAIQGGPAGIKSIKNWIKAAQKHKP